MSIIFTRTDCDGDTVEILAFSDGKLSVDTLTKHSGLNLGVILARTDVEQLRDALATWLEGNKS